MNALRRIWNSWTQRRTYSEKLRDAFAAEIQQRATNLFTSYGATIVPNTEEYPQSFDYAVVTVSVDDMLLRFVRGRMDFRVDVSPVNKPGAWREIGVVVKSASNTSNALIRKTDYYGLNDFTKFFHSNYDTLQSEIKNPNWAASRSWLTPI